MIRVAIYNEFYHERTDENAKRVYPQGIHMALKNQLEDEEISVRTITQDDIETGLTKEALEETDVLIWWGHWLHSDVPDDAAVRVREAVNSGMGFIVLHSGHHSKPFRLLMGTPCNLSWREEDGEYLWPCDPSHPIVQGIGRYIKLDKDEVYCEPFSIPEPDQLIFIANYAGGEAFRAGCCYRRGNGKIFYFQPGHETYPTYYNPDIIKVIRNAICWAKPEYRRVIDCPFVKKIGEE